MRAGRTKVTNAGDRGVDAARVADEGLRRKKNGGARSAAKFREETSKKQGGITAVLHCTMGSPSADCKS